MEEVERETHYTDYTQLIVFKEIKIDKCNSKNSCSFYLVKKCNCGKDIVCDDK